MWTFIGAQVLTCAIALASLWKDWHDFGSLSKGRFGRRLPIILALTTVVVALLSIVQSWRDSRATAWRDAQNTGRIEELGRQLQRNEDGAERRAGQQTKTFTENLTALQGRLSDLQTKIATEPILRQNRALLKQVDDIRQEVEAAKAHLEKPPDLAVLQSGFGDQQGQPLLTETAAQLGVDGTAQFTIIVLNTSKVQANNGAIYVRLCEGCRFAEEPARFQKAVGGHEYDRVMNFAAIHAGTAIAMPLKVIPPEKATRIELDVTVRCETCSVNETQRLFINLQR